MKITKAVKIFLTKISRANFKRSKRSKEF